MGVAVWLGWVLYAQRRVRQTPSAYLSAQPGLQDILPYVSRHLRWLNSYLLLGFVFLIFAMTHARTWGSRVLVYAFDASDGTVSLAAGHDVTIGGGARHLQTTPRELWYP